MSAPRSRSAPARQACRFACKRAVRVAFAGVHKRYGEIAALLGLDLEVVDGELLTLVGPSGSGKTTALRIAAGLESPSEGKVWIGGRDVTPLEPAERADWLVEYRWDRDTDILTASAKAPTSGDGVSGSVELTGADGSWLILDRSQNWWREVRVQVALAATLDAFSKYRRPAKILLVQAVGLGTTFEIDPTVVKRMKLPDRQIARIDPMLVLGERPKPPRPSPEPPEPTPSVITTPTASGKRPRSKSRTRRRSSRAADRPARPTWGPPRSRRPGTPRRGGCPRNPPRELRAPAGR